MKKDIKVPEVGESITEVTIGQWLKQNGDYVAMDEPICEIESDKASFEIPSEHEGTLKILVEEGETVEVGGKIAQIDTDSQKKDGKAEKATKEKSPPEEPEIKEAEKEASSPEKTAESRNDKPEKSTGDGTTYQIKVPEVGESITEVTIGQWLKKDGDRVEADDMICEIESDKASFEIPTEHAGVLKTKAAEGDTVAVGAVIAEIESDGAAEEAAEKKETAEKEPPAKGGEKAETRVKISPVAANILQEAGIAAESVQGTGPGGKITKEDANQAVAEAKEKKAAKPQKDSEEKPSTRTEETKAPQEAEGGEQAQRQVRRKRMSTLRKTISRRLVAAKNETAMLTTFNEVDMSAIKKLRGEYKERFKEKYDIGLGFMSFFTRAVCLALKEWPALNAIIDEDDIVYHDFCDISIAVSSPKGLVVPVVRNADRLSLAEIEREVLRLAEKARAGNLTIEEMTGGTFTITNGGVFGSLMSTPILNAPQSAILGMHKIEDRPVAINGEVVIRPMMYVAVSYDHRIVDGRESVSFLVRVKELLEDPSRMLLEV